MSEAKSKRQLLREKRQREQMRKRLLAIVAVVIGALLIAGVLVYPALRPVEYITPDFIERPNVDFNATGDPNAPITITEFSDYQCPFCVRFAKQTEPQLIEAYVKTGKVRFVYRSFGLFIGQESQDAAEASYCAGDQGKFWEYHDLLFANHTGENVGDYSRRRLEAFAEALQLDMKAFRDCLNSGKYAQRVTQDGIDGRALGVKATPSFVINYTVNGETKTRLIEGAQPFSTFKTVLDDILIEMGLQP